MSNEQIRFGLIGCGRIAQSHILACNETKEVKLVAVADVAEEVAASVSEAVGLSSYYTDFREMADKESLDAVIVCSPPDTHMAVVSDLMKRRVNVLCEKPFTITYDDALNLQLLSEVNGALLMMASKFRFVDDVIRSRGIIQAGMLGDVVLFDLAFCSRLNMNNRWNAKREVSGGGVLMDNGPHAVDIIRFLLGPIEQVQGRHGRQVQGVEVEDTSQLRFQSGGGVIGIVDLSWSILKGTDYYINVHGTEGMLQIGWRDSRYRQVEKADWITFGSGYNKQRAFNHQLRHFVECLRGNQQPIITIDDAVESVRVIEAAYRSVEENRWLLVEREKEVLVS